MRPETRETPGALEKILRGSSPEKFVNTEEKKNKKPQPPPKKSSTRKWIKDTNRHFIEVIDGLKISM